ncbi:WD40 repeat-like protein [Patellaria atrata CBS 101060]|uniref:WD40 repeat-like protein n=1 Tax=Patellaria atrata CBS 101060 TaxID=1346257 RepID=A0A9P4SF89_9PEZI|nr:WD40 repeat-like protein [Patellaria atrata CBS 101060]
MSSQFPTRQIAKLGGHNGPVHTLTYSSGLGQYLLTGSSDRQIRLFNPSTQNLIHTYSAHGYEILSLSVSADNARFASGGGDKTVFLWDVAACRTLRRWSGHVGRVNAVAMAGEGDSVVVSGSYDGTVRLWDCKAGGGGGGMGGGSGGGKAMMVLGEARDSVWAGSVDGKIRGYDIRTGEMFVDIIGYPITSVTATNAGDSLLISTLDSTLRLLDLTTGKLLKAYKDPSYMNTSYRLSSTLGLHDSVVLSGSENGYIVAWDLLSDASIHKLRHDSSSNHASAPSKRDVVSAVAFCPARKEWASAGGDGNVVVWGQA